VLSLFLHAFLTSFLTHPVQTSGRKEFGFKSLPTHCWPQQEAWKSQGVIDYKDATDASGARYVLLTFGTRLTRASVERRLAFLGVTFDTVETYGYKVHNARHNSPIVQAMQDPHNTPMHWSAGEAARPKRKYEESRARLAEQHDQKKLRQEQQREEEQTVQKLHQLMGKAHKAFYGAVRSANKHVKKGLDISLATGIAEQRWKLEVWEGTEWEAEHQNEFEQITSEWKALGGEPDQDSCDESDC
jgi:hypothetical protein